MLKEKKRKIKLKYPLLSMILILFIYSYILFWFWEELFPLVWISFGGCLLIIPIIWLINLIKSIIYITKDYKNIKRYVPLIIIFITTSIFWILHPHDMREEYEYKKYYDKRVEFIELIKNGNIEIEEKKSVQLPSDYKKISRTGKTYIYLNNEDFLLVGFTFDMSFPDGGSELVYCSGGETLIKENIEDIYKIHQKDKHWFIVHFN